MDGVVSSELFNNSNPNEFLSIAVIKLERLGLIEKEVRADNMYEYYTYSVTPDGLEYILANEAKIKASRKPKSVAKPVKAPEISFDSFDDDIPF